MLNICSIIGTRPEAIKMAPVAIAAQQRSGLRHRFVATGQHGALFDQAIDGFGLSVDQHLGIRPARGDLTVQVDAMRAAISAMLATNRPDIVLVQGDTNSAYAAALAAHDRGIQIGHVEAGLRTHIPERPWPEERNRCAIGQIAKLHFAPSRIAMTNLGRERVPGLAVLTGNTGIDALLMTMRPFAKANGSVRNIIVTCHRHENFGAPLANICHALRRIAQREDVRITFPLHPNSQVRDVVETELGRLDGITLTEPLDYHEMVAAIRTAHIVISDSGGLQEECVVLGIPLILMRDETERPEVIASGNCVLVGSNADAIVRETSRLLDDSGHHAEMSRPSFPYGDGKAAHRILDVITYLGSGSVENYGLMPRIPPRNNEVA